MAIQPVVWSCPCCNDKLEAENSVAMSWKQARHIRDHEDIAAVHAVLRAKASCSTIGCQLGGVTMKDGQGLPYPTDFDKKFLKLMNITWN